MYWGMNLSSTSPVLNVAVLNVVVLNVVCPQCPIGHVGGFLDTNCRWARVVTTAGIVPCPVPPKMDASAEPPPSKPDEVSLKTLSNMDVSPWNMLWHERTFGYFSLSDLVSSWTFCFKKYNNDISQRCPFHGTACAWRFSPNYLTRQRSYLHRGGLI